MVVTAMNAARNCTSIDLLKSCETQETICFYINCWLTSEENTGPVRIKSTNSNQKDGSEMKWTLWYRGLNSRERLWSNVARRNFANSRTLFTHHHQLSWDNGPLPTSCESFSSGRSVMSSLYLFIWFRLMKQTYFSLHACFSISAATTSQPGWAASPSSLHMVSVLSFPSLGPGAWVCKCFCSLLVTMPRQFPSPFPHSPVAHHRAHLFFFFFTIFPHCCLIHSASAIQVVFYFFVCILLELNIYTFRSGILADL